MNDECSLGWIKLYRKLQDHWLWDEKPFSKAQAWIDLLFLANHKGKKILLGNKLYDVERGSFVTSELKLMERWGWGKTKTRAFLELLQKEKMIEKKADHKKTVINIVNYAKHAVLNEADKPQIDHEQTTSRPRADTNKNIKNDKNVKNNIKENIIKENRHKYGEYKNVLLSDEEIEKLKAEFPNDYENRIERLSEYIASTGKKYKNHLATIRAWARKEKPVVEEEEYHSYYEC